jgi:hypothetical protein
MKDEERKDELFRAARSTQTIPGVSPGSRIDR